MADYGSFTYGTVKFPIPLMGSGLGGAGASFLRDADPALFYLLEFCASVIATHIEARFLEEVAAVGADGKIAAAVSEILPLDPSPYLTENMFKFPLLCAYRKGTRAQWVGPRKFAVDEVELSYVLPPLEPGEAERLVPVLKAIHRLLDNRIDMGFDPEYAPTTPALPAGTPFWQPAGLASSGVTGASYGAYAPTDRLFFPAVTMSLELKERVEDAVEQFEEMTDQDVHVDLASATEETLQDVAQFQVDTDG